MISLVQVSIPQDCKVADSHFQQLEILEQMYGGATSVRSKLLPGVVTVELLNAPL